MKLLSKAAIAAVFAAPVAFSSPSFAQSACAPGTIASYLALGTTGCISGDIIYSNFSFTGFGPTTGLSVTDNGPQHTFSAAGLNFVAGTVASYSYTVAIAPGNPYATFLGYRTGATDSDILDPLVGTKTLTGTPNGDVSTSTNGILGNPVLYNPRILGPVTFTGTINVTSGRMDVFTDSVAQQIDVPGPLPVLGAAAAFGYSRRLRKRISTCHRR